MARARKAAQPAGLLRDMVVSAARMMTHAWTPAAVPTRRRSTAGRVTEVEGFGSNPGALRMLVYQPPGPPRSGAPLIIVLHGCRQGAESFATHSGWLDIAKAHGIPLVLPEQMATNNRNRCFNWYRPGDVARGQGEAMSIRQMVSSAARRFGSDRRRVFIVGLSAGGAMAGAMLAAYPAVFAAGAIVAGMPIGAANTSPMALLRMHRADPFRTGPGLAAELRARAPLRGKQPWPRVSIWQGERDRTVDPANAELLAAQWSGIHNAEEIPTADPEPQAGARRRVWGRAARPAVELWTLADMAHGFPVDATSRLGSAGPWVLEAGISAAARITAFWGLERPGH